MEMCLDSAELYNPVTDRWTLLPPMHTARAACGGAEISSLCGAPLFIVAGGCNSASSCLRSVEELDPRFRSWIRLPDMPLGLYGCAAAGVAAVGHRRMSVIGYDASNELALVEYDHAAGRWTQRSAGVLWV